MAKGKYDNYYYSGSGSHGRWRNRQNHRSYTVCQICDRWVFDDRKKEFCTCGARFDAKQGQGPEPTPYRGSEISEGLARLSGLPATKPIADLLQALLQAAGVQVDEAGPVSHAQKVKESLQGQRKALDTLHRIEKAQAARKAKIEALQAQIDSVTKDYVKGKEDLDLARVESDQAQEEHRKLLDEPEFSDCVAEDSDMHDVEQDIGDVKDDPAVIAGKRSYLHALLEAKKRKAEESARLEQADGSQEEPRGPVLQQEPAASGDGLSHGLAEATQALAAASGDPASASAALASINQITGALARVAAAGAPAFAAPKPKAASRSSPYGAKATQQG